MGRGGFWVVVDVVLDGGPGGGLSGGSRVVCWVVGREVGRAVDRVDGRRKGNTNGRARETGSGEERTRGSGKVNTAETANKISFKMLRNTRCCFPIL